MSYKYFSQNGTILPAAQASVPLDNVAYQYGFGVYETIRVANGTIYFLEDHGQRLMQSAKIISLSHNFSADTVRTSVQALLQKNNAGTCNIKILLLGGPTAADATLYIVCLNPLFPDRKLYKTGASAITYPYERDFPHAKSLNMLSSYLAYKQAREAGAYDALLVNRSGHITEGTRTNFFVLKDRTIISPPETDILLGVTRQNVLKVARQAGFKVEETNIKPADLGEYDAAFLTSTSTKILPLQAVDKHLFGPPTEAIHELIQAFGQFLNSYRHE